MTEIRKPFEMVLPEDVGGLAHAFKREGFELYVVGGAVRDAVMGVKPKDYDLATNATPEQVIGILRPIRVWSFDEVGRAFGVVRARLQNPDPEVLCREYEIATFREDIGAGRRPDSVVFTTIEGDVKRRDLTINALFYDIQKGELVDLVGGLADIEARVVRTVGDPFERFAEDRLRVLRCLRFASKLGYRMHSDTEAAIVKDSNLYGVSAERVRDEFVKAVHSAQSVPRLIEQLTAFGMWERIFPGLQVDVNFDSLVSTRGVDTRTVPVLLAILLERNDVAAVRKRLNELKYSDVEVRQIAFLMQFRELTIGSSFRLRKAFLSSALSMQDLATYFLERGLPQHDLMYAFFSYLAQAPIKGDTLLGEFSGKQLGVELERQEVELFRGLL